MNEKDQVYIYSAPRPLLHSLLAALLFTLCLYMLYRFINIASFKLIEEAPKAFASPLQIAIISAGFGIYFSLIVHHQFDLKNRRYKKLFGIGPFKYGKWTSLKNLEYISVFLKGDDDNVFVNLWYGRNNHITLAVYNDVSFALEAGEEIARKLGIDLLDAATDPQYSQWIDLN